MRSIKHYKTHTGPEKQAEPIHGTPPGVKTKPPREEEKEERIPIRVRPSKVKREGVLSPPTSARNTKGPERGEDPVVFVTYSPQERPKDTSIVANFPPDPSGDNSKSGIVLQTGNQYIRYSTDRGKTFTISATKDVIDSRFAGGEHGDQVMIFVPAIQCFVWYLQYFPDPTTKDGAFRIAIARSKDLQTNLAVWYVFNFVSSDFHLPGVDFDFPDMAATDTFLYVTTGTDNQGRLVMRLSLKDLAAGKATFEYITPLLVIDKKDPGHDGLRFTNFCQQAHDRGMWAGHVDSSTIRIYEWPDSSGPPHPPRCEDAY